MDMTEGPLFKKIVTYSIPIILASLLQLLYNASDMVVVGRFGAEGSLGAVGNTSPLINLIVNILIGLSVGTCVIIARLYGQRDHESAGRAAHTSIVIALVGGLSVAAFGFFLARPLLQLMDTPVDVIDRSVLYMKIYFLGMPGNMLYNFGAAIMKAEGDTRRPLYYLAFTGLINVLLNLVLVIVFHLDVAGVAIATIVAQYLSAVLVIAHLLKNDGPCKIVLSKLKINKHELVMIARIGLPAGIQGSLFSISNVIIQSSINWFDNPLIMDGNAAALNLEGFIFTSMNSVSQTTLAFVSQNLGAAKFKRIDKSIIMTASLSSAIGLVMGSLFCIFSTFLLSLYNTNPEVIQYGQLRMYYICTTYCFCGLMDALSSAMRGLGKSTTSMAVSLLGVCAFRIVWIYTVFASTHDLTWLYLSYPISWFLTSAVLLVCVIFARKSEEKKILQYKNRSSV